ncbi:MAG: hypothetical protein EBS23_00095 [Betaproteobacteria bacterium]|nr:hypothetical protein [Betaproteobacteria bacterium]
MTELQTALVLAGVGVVVLVYFYNWWVSMRRRREIERAVAAHSGRSRASAPDPLDAPAATAAGARREPVVERIEPVSAPADSPVATGFEEPPAGDTAARVEPAMVMAPAAKPAAAQRRRPCRRARRRAGGSCGERCAAGAAGRSGACRRTAGAAGAPRPERLGLAPRPA